MPTKDAPATQSQFLLKNDLAFMAPCSAVQKEGSKEKPKSPLVDRYFSLVALFLS